VVSLHCDRRMVILADVVQAGAVVSPISSSFPSTVLLRSQTTYLST
jgi:hypothetical protein